MPPRKRARVSQAASPTPTPTAKSPTPNEPSESPSRLEEAILNDPWTDEEEIGLYKGIIKWKPTGIHKHFRMLQLRQYLLENGYIHPRAVHTKPEGIWQKLGSLYDLEALDQREDARQLSDLSAEDSDSDAKENDEEDEDDIYSVAENKIRSEEFSLPEEEYGDAMWTQRLAGDKERRDESPGVLEEVNLAVKRPVTFTPSFSVEPDAATPLAPSRRGRGGGRGVSGRGRGAGAASGMRRSARVTESVVEESGSDEEESGSEEDEDDEKDEEDDDNGNDEDEESGDEDEEEEDESEEEKASQASTPAPRSSRGGRGRGRGGTVGRGRGRGRRRG